MRRYQLTYRIGLASVLALPVLAGLGFAWLADAPSSYLFVNAATLVPALGWIVCASPLFAPGARRYIGIGLVALLALPLATGPQVDGVARWIPVGQVALHIGMIVVPVLAIVCAARRAWAPALLGCALAACALQPDAASALALTGAAAAIAIALSSRAFLAVAGLGVPVTGYAFLTGDLAPQPFVEGVLALAWRVQPIAAMVLAGTLVYAVGVLVRKPASLRAPSGGLRAPALALAGTLAGFVAMSLLGPYPTPLVGYGAAPILGFGIALGALPALTRAPMRSQTEEKRIR